MKRTFEEIVDYHCKRIGADEVARKKFFCGGVAIQNDQKNYDKNYLERKMALTCEVMCRINGCRKECDSCPLEVAHKRACEEIDMGLRIRQPEIDNYILRVSIDRKTGTITRILTMKEEK